jgi:uroporphyrinogen decarboxylase
MLKGAYLIGPYTLAALLLGADDAAVASIEDPRRLHALCDFAAETIQEYGRLLISAGADVIAVLEPSAVMLGPRQFGEFSASYVKDIVAGFKYSDVAVLYHTCGNTMHLIDRMAASGAVGLSLDAPETGVDLVRVARTLPPDILVMGNISPTAVMLRAAPAGVERAVAALLADMRDVPNFILSTGCDLPQETPPANIEAFMRAGRAEPRPAR